MLLRLAASCAFVIGATIGVPAEAAVTAFFSAGTTCGGAASANFVTGGAPVKASLCVNTTAEPICGATLQLRSASSAEDGRFFVTDRVLGAALPDPDSASLTYPIAITNPPAAVDLGGTTSVSTPTPAGSNVLLATFDLTPQANATNNSYAVSLGGFSALASDANCLSGAAVDIPLTASFTLNRIAAPLITSASATTFIVANPNTFTITATGSPAPTLSVAGMPSGVTFNPATGVLGGTPALGTVGSYTLVITASNAAGSDTRFFTLTVIKSDQTISFTPPPNQPFSTSTVPLSATATSGIAVTFTSTTPSVCTVTASTLTMVAAGTCSIDANQAGSPNYNPAPTVTGSFTISAIAPTAPTITAAAPGNTSATISFNPPANYGGSPITTYTATCNPGGFTGTSGGSPVVVTGLSNGTLYTCSVTATNAIGTSPPSGTLTVTPTAAATPPTIASPSATTFTVTTAGSFTVAATGNPAPTLAMSGTLPSGVTFTPATGVLAGTPALGTVGIYPLSFSATNASGTATQPFTLTIAKADQTITFTGPANQPFSATPIALSATASSGLAVTFSSTTPAVCTVSGTSLTMVTAGTCSVVADQAGNLNYNAAVPVTRSFAIAATVPGAPTITSMTFFSGAATINFAAPASNGGSPITSYTATCNPGGFTATSTSSPIRVTGLTNGTTYTCSVTATNASGTGASSPTMTVTPNVTTTFSGPSATGTGIITASFTGGGPTCSFTSARFIPVTGDPASPPAGTSPAGVSFPHGLFDFTIGGCTSASTITMTITYPGVLPPGTQYWKYGPTVSTPARWYVLPSGITVNVVTFGIRDGGLGDDDLAANGTIVDQGGPGVGGTGPGIPALGPWMLVLLGLLLAGVAMRRLR